MQKQFLTLLSNTNFEARYLGLWEHNKALEGTIKLSQQEVAAVFEANKIAVTYHKREKFYKLLDHREGVHLQLNIIVSDSRVTFVFYAEDAVNDWSVGGPYGMLAKKLNKKLKVSPKIAYNSKETLAQAVQEGIAFFEMICDELLTAFQE